MRPPLLALLVALLEQWVPEYEIGTLPPGTEPPSPTGVGHR